MTVEVSKLRQHLEQSGQAHVLAHWDNLSAEQRAALHDQINSIDLKAIETLYLDRDKVYEVPDESRIQPAPVIQEADIPHTAKARGESLLAGGKVAALVVAGGQGSRLGFEHPKGMYPIGPVSQRTLFQIHVQKILALQKRFGGALPLIVMTSPATDEETRTYFKQNGNLGLRQEDLHFFCQGTMPAVDLATGKLLMEAPHQLFASPDGHGGMLAALANSGTLKHLRDRGVEALYYFQVDNPLVKIADPTFLGVHSEQRAEISIKIVPKEDPLDKMGNLVLIDGRCSIIEYSDLPKELGAKRTPDGKLWIWAGSPAIHIFDLAFLERMTSQGVRIPFHVARKKVPFVDANGQQVQPEKENALKFERFIFDLLPLADRYVILETSRSEEFMPLKNGSGPDSPSTVRQALSNFYGGWLEQAGVKLPHKANGDVGVAVEISPLFAMGPEELKQRLPASWSLQGDSVLLEG
jgi:UDP-N-acetylglucosamine/UDP-N-acetylgalactosamine diphosphorylase